MTTKLNLTTKQRLALRWQGLMLILFPESSAQAIGEDLAARLRETQKENP